MKATLTITGRGVITLPTRLRNALALVEAAVHELWADAHVLAEARRNLSGKAPEGLVALEAIASRITTGRALGGRPLEPGLTVLPEKDRPVLAAAIHHQCDLLVTGERSHCGPSYGKSIRGVTVMSPAMLAVSVLG